jgi:N-alpha-acetyltransferase 35, NatC auxiliary subunit
VVAEPPPIVSTEGILAFDITEKFFSATDSKIPSVVAVGPIADSRAAALSPGELLKDGYFTLFESVAALEVGISFPVTPPRSVV